MYYRSATQYLTTALLPLPHHFHYPTTVLQLYLYYSYTSTTPPLPHYFHYPTTVLLLYSTTSIPRYFHYPATVLYLYLTTALLRPPHYLHYADPVPQIYRCYSTTSIPGYFPYHATHYRATSTTALLTLRRSCTTDISLLLHYLDTGLLSLSRYCTATVYLYYPGDCTPPLTIYVLLTPAMHFCACAGPKAHYTTLYHKCNTNFYILHLALSQQVLQTSLRITL